MGDRWTNAVLLLGTVFSLAQLGDVVGAWGYLNYDLACVVAAAGAFWGLRRNRPTPAGPWNLLFAGLATFVVADLAWNGLALADRTPDGATGLDVLYLTAYPLLTVGALRLARQRGPLLRREAVLDGLALVVPAAAIGWAIVVQPSLAEGLSTVDLAVAVAYPLLDLLLVAAACWLGFGSRPAAPAQVFLLLGLLATFVADVVYAAVEAAGVDLPVDDVAWVLGYVLIACAFMHPSMTTLGQPTDNLGTRLSRRRFVLLGGAPAVIPALLIVRHADTVDDVLIGLASVLVIVVVVARLAGLLRELDRARRAEVRAERRFRALVQDAGELLVVIDRAYRVSYISPAIKTILGLDPDEVVGRVGGRLVHPDDRDHAGLALDDVTKRPGDTVRFQFRLRTVGGEWRWFDATATNLLIDPDVEGIVIHQRDVTAQRLAVDALRARARQQEAVARIGQLALDGTATERLLDEAAVLVRAALGVASCQLYRIDGDRLLLEAASPDAGDGDATTISIGTLAMGESVAAAAEASVAVGGPNGPYGSLIVHANEPRAFAGQEMAFLQSAANALALVLERRATEADVSWRAMHDGLTGLPNRYHMLEKIDEALRANDPGDVAVLFCDVDHFKVVNDGLGHDAGDRLLVAVAERLVAAAAPADIVARFGGDEFVVVRAGVGGSGEAAELAQQLLGAIGRPLDLGGDRLQLDASIGIAVAARGQATATSVLRDADAAMYRAKERGRARVEIFDDDLRAQVVHRLRTEAALRGAVAGGELRLHYQPVVHLGTGQTIAVEALLRWLRPGGKLLAPAAFIPLAEEHGLIEELGAWVLHEACRQLATWDRLGNRVEMAVNIAPRQLLGGDLPAVVNDACRAAGIDPSRLTLELTERAVLRDADAAVRAAQELADLGVRLSIDDFGTGWSSLAYLKRLPVTELKIDRSFVSEMTEGGADTAIVEASVRLGHTLGLRTVAEGIETAEQAAALTALGCDRGQGYLLCPPLPPEELVLDQVLTPEVLS